MIGENRSASISLCPNDAVWLGNCTVNFTLLRPEPAGSVSGVIVVIAPFGTPVTERVRAAGKVVPVVGPMTRA